MEWVNTIIQGILLGGLYALYGTGLSLIFGVMRLVNLAHGDLLVAATYMAMVIVTWLSIHPLVSLVFVIPIAFIVGFIFQRGVLNQTLGKGLMPPLLITFGLSIIIQNVLQLQFSADSQDLDAGSLETASLRVTEQVNIGVMPLITFIVAVGILIALQLFLSRTSLGRAFRATSDDPETAELMGINSRQIYGFALGVSLVTVAIAGVMLGIRTNFAPSSGPSRLLFAYETVIIGGLGNLWGTLIGGLILGLSQNIGAQIRPAWFQLAGHVVTLLVLIIRPNGLFARTRDK
jgi:branched-chain amino acid transport system permease protein